MSDTDSIVSYNTRSAVKRRAELLERGFKLDEQDLKSESNEGNATPSNLQNKFDQVALEETTPVKRHIHKTPDTERKRRLIRQETARKGVYSNSFTSTIVKIVVVIGVVVFLGSFMLHESTLSYKDFSQIPNDWDQKN